MELARVSFVFAVTVILFVILVLHTTDQIAAATGTASASSGLCAQNAIARPELVLDSSYLILFIPMPVSFFAHNIAIPFSLRFL